MQTFNIGLPTLCIDGFGATFGFGANWLMLRSIQLANNTASEQSYRFGPGKGCLAKEKCPKWLMLGGATPTSCEED